VSKATARKSSPAPWEIVAAEFAAAARELKSLPPEALPEIAFAGRSNVGKSSLLNALLGRRKLARTSSTPGCTRQLGFFKARARDGAAMMLVDLPGYGFAVRSKAERAAWGSLVETYLAQREVLCGVVLLVDARRGVEAEELALVEYLAGARAGRDRRVPMLLVATKIDKIPASRRRAALAALRTRHRGHVVGVSATTGEGLDELWQALRRTCG
jgi:GTP-binding protein